MVNILFSKNKKLRFYGPTEVDHNLNFFKANFSKIYFYNRVFLIFKIFKNSLKTFEIFFRIQRVPSLKQSKNFRKFCLFLFHTILWLNIRLISKINIGLKPTVFLVSPTIIFDMDKALYFDPDS